MKMMEKRRAAAAASRGGGRRASPPENFGSEGVMSPRDILSALLAATVWGLTFVAIKFGVGEAPPLLLTALRFAFAAVPAVFFIKPPAATPGLVVLYGLLDRRRAVRAAVPRDRASGCRSGSPRS